MNVAVEGAAEDAAEGGAYKEEIDFHILNFQSATIWLEQFWYWQNLKHRLSIPTFRADVEWHWISELRDDFEILL